MVPQGPPAPFEGSQAVPSQAYMWSNSGLLGSSGSGMPSQGGFSSMVSPRNQLGNMNMLGSMPNVSSLLQQSLANGGPSPGISGPGSGQQQRVLMDDGAESNPLGNGMGCNGPSGSFVSSSQNAKANGTGTFQGGQQFSSPNMNQMLADLQTNSQMDPNYYQHCQQPSMNQFKPTGNPQNHLQQQQQQGQSIRAGLGAVGMVKPEPQTTSDQTPQQLQATIQSSPGPVKLEPQQLQNMRTLPPVKMEPQGSDSPLFSPHQQQQLQQQQQQYLNASRQSPHAAAQISHQQRLTQLQQHQQQQQLAKGIHQQRVPVQHQFQAQNLATRSPVKPVYEPGTCARRLTHYMYQQQRRPEDNNIEYWKKFVAEFFAPNAKKKWCVSMYGSRRQITGVFPQDIWHCEICNKKPGRGFEATVEVLPRLFKLKYESGTLDELLYVDMPREYQNSSGQIVLDYAKAIQESVFEQLRVVRDGQLRVVFSQDLKICSWEFCARRHEELIPKRLLIPQVQQLGAAAQKYQSVTQGPPANISVPDLQNNCNMFIASARQLVKTLEVPLVNDLGYSKRYVRCLQISEVVNSMKDLIDFSRESGVGPMESLAKFPRRTGSFSRMSNGQPQVNTDQPQQQQENMPGPNSNGDDCIRGAVSMQACSNGTLNVNNPGNTSANRLLHQNSMNSRQQNQMNNGGGGMSPYMGTNSQLQSPSSSSTTLPQTQTIPSPIRSPMPSSSNNPQQQQQQLAVPSSSDTAANESQSSVQKIIQDMMLTSQLGGVGGGGSMMGMNNMGKNTNGLLPTTNNNGLVGNGFSGNSGFGNGRGVGGVQDAAMVNGIRAALRNNSSMTTAAATNGRIGMSFPREQSLSQQHDMGNNQQPINGLGSVNGFSNLQFDWKTSP